MPLAHPLLQPLVAPAVDDPLGRDAGQSCVRDGVVTEAQLASCMCVAVEGEDAARGERALGEAVVDILPVPVAIEFDSHPAPGRLREHDIPVRRDTRTGIEHPPARMPKDCHPRRLHRVHHPRRLRFLAAQLRMRRRDHEFEQRSLVRLDV